MFLSFRRKIGFDISYAGLGGSDAHPTGDQEVAGSIPAGSGSILLWRLIGHSVLSADRRRTVVSFWQKSVHKHWFTA